MKYAFIRDHRDEFDIQAMCEILGTSKSGYYDWLTRDHDGKEKRLLELKTAIERAFKGGRGTYGSPRVYLILKGLGYEVSEETVAKLMQELGLRAKAARRFKVCTTDSNHSFPIAENKLGQVFDAAKPGEVMLADITFIPTSEGWLYLAAVLDLATRQIIGWAMGDTIDRHLTIASLHMALRRQKPAPGAIFHSDRGSQYACYDFRDQLLAHGLTPSMSRIGNCWDNAPMESFFHTLKVEFVHQENFATRAEAKLKIFEWIETFYNRQRLHSSLGYKTPVAFAAEKMLDAA